MQSVNKILSATFFTVPKVAQEDFARPGNIPHQVSLYSNTQGHFCDGSIIHPFLILGAAHCFGSDKPPNIKVRAVLAQTTVDGDEDCGAGTDEQGCQQ